MRRRTLVALVGAAALTTTLAACSADTATQSPDASPTASESAAANAADIAFAQSMIPHHQQAVMMAGYATAKESGASANVRQLAQQIKDAQGPEIEQMTHWLNQWGAPTAMPSGSDGSMEGHDMGGITMNGMMDTADMEELHNARGAEFDRMWLEMMIEHHQGAIAMAKQVKSASANPEVTKLADEIITAQQSEITVMQKDLDQLGTS